MYKKLKLIKMILSTILISLFIINIFKSCSFAYTWEDMYNFSDYVRNNGISNYNKSTASNFYNRYTQLTTLLTNNGANPSNYTNFILQQPNSISVNFYFYNITSNSTISINGSNQISVNNITGIRGTYYLNSNSLNGTPYSMTSFSTSGYDYRYMYGLQEINISDYKSVWLENKYIYIKVLIGISDMVIKTNELPLPIAEIKVLSTQDYNNIDLYQYGEIVGTYEFNELSSTTSGKKYNLILESTNNNMENGAITTIRIHNGDTTILESQEFLINWENVASVGSFITNPSGELIFNLDLGNIENKLDNINNTIYSGDTKIIEELQQIESGEKSRFDYWVGFFNPSGDNISNQILNESGDIFGISYRNIDNYGIFDFIHNIFDSIYELLFNNTTNVSLDMGMFGYLNSADFTINNSSINTFISSILNPTLIIITLFFYYRFIKLLATLDLSVLEKFDVDNNIKLF